MPQAKIHEQKAKEPNFSVVSSESMSEPALKNARERAFKRIEDAHAKREIGSYVHWGETGIEEVICKECGTPLRGYVPLPTHRERRTIDGKETVFERMVFATFAAYTEVTIDFDDGSHHVTITCKDCAQKLTLEDIEWHYATDMYEMDVETKGEMKWQFYADRKPVAFHVSYVGENR